MFGFYFVIIKLFWKLQGKNQTRLKECSRKMTRDGLVVMESD